MISKKIEIQKIEKIYRDEKYILYLIPEDDCVACYIQKKDYGIMCYCIGIPKEREQDFTFLIDNNIAEWVKICEEKTYVDEYANRKGNE